MEFMAIANDIIQLEFVTEGLKENPLLPIILA